MAEFAIAPGREGQVRSINPALLSILQTAAAAAPPTISKVEAFSGKTGRSTGTANHPSGRAVDITLYDQSGKKLDNCYGNPFGVHSASDKAAFQTYEQFAQVARQTQEQLYPSLADNFRWGGYFQGGVNPGDTMHFDLSGGLSKGYPAQTDRWQNGMPIGTLADISQGAGALSGFASLDPNAIGQRPAMGYADVPLPNLRPAQGAIAAAFPNATQASSLLHPGQAFASLDPRQQDGGYQPTALPTPPADIPNSPSVPYSGQTGTTYGLPQDKYGVDNVLWAAANGNPNLVNAFAADAQQKIMATGFGTGLPGMLAASNYIKSLPTAAPGYASWAAATAKADPTAFSGLDPTVRSVVEKALAQAPKDSGYYPMFNSEMGAGRGNAAPVMVSQPSNSSAQSLQHPISYPSSSSRGIGSDFVSGGSALTGATSLQHPVSTPYSQPATSLQHPVSTPYSQPSSYLGPSNPRVASTQPNNAAAVGSVTPSINAATPTYEDHFYVPSSAQSKPVSDYADYADHFYVPPSAKAIPAGYTAPPRNVATYRVAPVQQALPQPVAATPQVQQHGLLGILSNIFGGGATAGVNSVGTNISNKIGNLITPYTNGNLPSANQQQIGTTYQTSQGSYTPSSYHAANYNPTSGGSQYNYTIGTNQAGQAIGTYTNSTGKTISYVR